LKPRNKQDDDAKVLSDAMEGVKPLPPHNLAERPVPQPPRTHIRRTPGDGETEADPEQAFIRNGIQKTVLRKLRNGQIAVEGELDLHGRGVSEAEQELRAFLRNKQSAAGRRAVRVIHGKGHGSPNQKSVLKEKVNEWLRQSDAVLAFCPAGPTDGGTGAVRVLLKRK